MTQRTGTQYSDHHSMSRFGRRRVMTRKKRRRNMLTAQPTPGFIVAAYTLIAISPPGLTSGTSARNACSVDGVWWSTPIEKTTSNEPRRKGKRKMSLLMISTLLRSDKFAAAAFTADDKSTPTASAAPPLETM